MTMYASTIIRHRMLANSVPARTSSLILIVFRHMVRGTSSIQHGPSVLTGAGVGAADITKLKANGYYTVAVRSKPRYSFSSSSLMANFSRQCTVLLAVLSSKLRDSARSKLKKSKRQLLSVRQATSPTHHSTLALVLPPKLLLTYCSQPPPAS